MYCSERLSVDVYYMIETVNLLISDLGEKYVKSKYEELEKDWEKTKKDIIVLNKHIAKVKTFYDAIEDKKFAKKEKKEIILKKFFLKTASKVALLQRELYDCFVTLIKISTLQRQTIPSDAFKILEHTGFRKIEPHKRQFGQSEIIAEGGTG